jgi:hypothetical protein
MPKRAWLLLSAALLLTGVVFAVMHSSSLAQEPTPTPTPAVTPMPTPTPTPRPGEEEVEDVGKVNVEKLPPSEGRFVLKGRVTAVDAANAAFSVNGLSIRLADGAKVRGGPIKALTDVLVNDRVEVSGRIKDGVLFAERVVVKGPDIAKRVTRETVKGLSQDEIEKLRQDIMKRIDEILKQIEELRRGR